MRYGKGYWHSDEFFVVFVYSSTSDGPVAPESLRWFNSTREKVSTEEKFVMADSPGQVGLIIDTNA